MNKLISNNVISNLVDNNLCYIENPYGIQALLKNSCANPALQMSYMQ